MVLSAELAGRLGVAREWMLGKVLPGQREGAAVWFHTLKATLKEGDLIQCPESPTVWSNSSKTLALMTHVDDMVMTGEETELERIENFLKQKFKLAVEGGSNLSFLKRSIEIVDGTTKIRSNSKYIEGLVNLFHGVKRRRTPGEVIINNEPLVDEAEIQKYRSAVGTLLYVSGDRPDTQFFIKELASKLQTPTKGSMQSLVNLIGYMVSTKDYHLVMTGTNPSRSFRHRAEGLSDAPWHEEKKGIWLLEVATDSDWSGNRETRSSTSCGSIYLGGNWIHSYSRTQKLITLSSTEAEFVALVGGASEGLLLKAVIQHLVNGEVELKLFGDNTASIALASKDGVGKLKHVSGRLLWIQQRQQLGDLQLRRVDTLTNPSDLGTKVLSGKRVKLLLFLCGFANDWNDLGWDEWREEKLKKETREKIKAVRKIVDAEMVETDVRQGSTMVNQLAKRLMRLTLGALLLSGGEALGLPSQSSMQCLVAVETTTLSSPLTTTMLVTVVFVLVGVIGVLLRIMHVMHLRIEATRDAMDWVRQQLRQTRDRRIIREEEQQRLGVWLESADEANSDESDGGEREAGDAVALTNGTAHIRTVKREHPDEYDENFESEDAEEDIEVEITAAEGGTAAGGEDFDYDWDSIALDGTALDAGDETFETGMETEQEEPEEEDDIQTDYGSIAVIDEDFSAFEELDPEDYDNYRFALLAEARGVEHYVIQKLAYLRSLPVTRSVWRGIQELFSIHKSIQLGGVATRKRAINFIMGRKRYQFWYEQGRIPPGERLEESEMPDEWIAAHYGWGEPVGPQSDMDAGEIESWSPSEAGDGGEAEEAEEEKKVVNDLPPPVVTDEASQSDMAGTSPTLPSSSSGLPSHGKCGGKGRTVEYVRDPPNEDEADGNI